MANVTTKIPLDNFVQNGDQTLSELLAAVAAVNGGNNPSVAEVVRDPSTGRLVQVQLSFPDSVAQAAIDAINANVGVPTTVVEIPPALAFTDLATADGLAWSGASLTVGDERIQCALKDTLAVVGGAFALGGSFEGVTYTDGNNLLTAVGMFLTFQQRATAGDFTINSGDLVIKNVAGATVTISLTNPIVIPQSALVGDSSSAYWVDSTGKLYKRRETVGGVTIIGNRSYEDAVQSGAA